MQTARAYVGLVALAVLSACAPAQQATAPLAERPDENLGVRRISMAGNSYLVELREVVTHAYPNIDLSMPVAPGSALPDISFYDLAISRAEGQFTQGEADQTEATKVAMSYCKSLGLNDASAGNERLPNFATASKTGENAEWVFTDWCRIPGKGAAE